MKKLGIYAAVVASFFYCLPVNTTLSYLTSEKSSTAPISLGTNEDVFLVDTASIQLRTNVKKDISVKKEKQGDGSTKESKQVKTNVSLGSQLIIFTPQRPNLFLDGSNFTVEGFPKGAIKIETAQLSENAEVPNGFVFRVSHSLQAVQFESSRKKGQLHIHALGGFYDVRIPLTLDTQYNEETAVEEIQPPPPPPTEGTKPPAEEPKPPTEGTNPPVEETKPPVEENQPSGDQAKSANKEDQPPSNVVAAPITEGDPAHSAEDLAAADSETLDIQLPSQGKNRIPSVNASFSTIEEALR